MPYPIWPSDAVLLGRALEEYLQANDDSDVYFLDFLWSRMGPFYPPINSLIKIEAIEVGRAPHDIAWEIAVDGFFRHGFAPSSPNSWFFGSTTANRAARVTLEQPVRRLLDEVAELVAPFVARNAADDARFSLTREAPWGQIQERAFLYLESGSRRSRSGADEPDQIETLLEQLVARPENDCILYFRAGRALGLVLAHCHRYERKFIRELYLSSLKDERVDPDDDNLAEYSRAVHLASNRATEARRGLRSR